MSLVYLTHHNENVRDYDHVGLDLPQVQKKMKYVSQHKNHVKKQIHQAYITDGPNGIKLITDWGKHERRTMGCARTPLNPPHCFLRKNEGLKWRRQHDHVCPPGMGLAPVPRVSQLDFSKPCDPKKKKAIKEEPEKPAEQSVPCACAPPPVEKPVVKKDTRCKRKNFIALNRKRVIQSKTRRPPPYFVDTPNGDRQNLINSGLIPQFVCGKNFTKVPCYIKAHKRLLKKYREACAREHGIMDSCQEYMIELGVRQMTVEERLQLLEGLRINYIEQLKTFQNLSLYTDTPTKKLRKSRLEKDLLQLENYIQFLEDNPVIYISDF